jgi:hypothetical protein
MGDGAWVAFAASASSPDFRACCGLARVLGSVVLEIIGT